MASKWVRMESSLGPVITPWRLTKRSRCCRMSGALVRCNHCLPGNRLKLSVVGAELGRSLHTLCQAHAGHLDFLGGTLEGGQWGNCYSTLRPKIWKLLACLDRKCCHRAVPGTGSSEHALDSAGGRSCIKNCQVQDTQPSINGWAQSSLELMRPLPLPFCGHST